MPNQIKPRYRLGTQNMLDLAKDDARKIPERTLFRLGDAWVEEEGAVVVRYDDNVWRANASSAAFVALDGGAFHSKGYSYDKAFFNACELQPLI